MWQSIMCSINIFDHEKKHFVIAMKLITLDLQPNCSYHDNLKEIT